MSGLVDRVPPGRLYGRRRARPLRPGQRRLQEELLPQLTVDLSSTVGPIDPRAFFPKPVPQVWLEIGFGAHARRAVERQGARVIARHPRGASDVLHVRLPSQLTCTA